MNTFTFKKIVGNVGYLELTVKNEDPIVIEKMVVDNDKSM